jgi:hypothetical protein
MEETHPNEICGSAAMDLVGVGDWISSFMYQHDIDEDCKQSLEFNHDSTSSQFCINCLEVCPGKQPSTQTGLGGYVLEIRLVPVQEKFVQDQMK